YGSLVFLGFAITAPLQAQHTIDVRPGSTITIQNNSGSIRIYGSERRDLVVLRGSSDLERELELEKDGKNIQISANTAELQVRLPSDAHLFVKNQSGSVTISGMTKTLEVETSSGHIEVEGVVESLHLESLSGGINASGATEKAYAESISGSVTLMRVEGIVDARSTSGAVRINGRDVKDAKLSSVSGSVVFRGTLTRDARLEAESSSASVEITIPNNFSATYDLSSINGHIENDFGPRPTQPRNGTGATLRFSTGGSARIVATTVSGSIHLNAL
ncbi:MAG TPA: DUF4097 family beta strand repeat-containing protein, partial [Longimicrobiales bacterium]|nr:DUF4097 family beta strand repeat-containing protein [Longimicrobiales bacterium]